MVQVKIHNSQESAYGGQSTVIAVGKDGKETILEQHYTGYEEYSHGIAVVWYLKARHHHEEQKGDIIEIWKYDLRSGDPDINYLNTTPFASYSSKDSGQNWIKI